MYFDNPPATSPAKRRWQFRPLSSSLLLVPCSSTLSSLLSMILRLFLLGFAASLSLVLNHQEAQAKEKKTKTREAEEMARAWHHRRRGAAGARTPRQRAAHTLNEPKSSGPCSFDLPPPIARRRRRRRRQLPSENYWKKKKKRRTTRTRKLVLWTTASRPWRFRGLRRIFPGVLGHVRQC